MNGLFSVLILIVVSVSACVTGPHTLRDKESVLRARVQAFWAAKGRGDWKTAETYVDPDVRPDLEPYFKQLREGPRYAEFKSVEINAVKIMGEAADVSVKYSVKWMHPLLAGMQAQDRQSNEKWRKKKGVWYRVMEKADPLKVFQKLTPSKGGR